MIKNYYDRKDNSEKELWYKTYFETDIAKTSTTKMSTAVRSTFSNARTAVSCIKHIMILKDDSNISSKWQVSPIDDARVIIYNSNMFIIQATYVNQLLNFFSNNVILCQCVVFWLNRLNFFMIGKTI